MTLTIATLNLNTWINKAKKNIRNEQIWQWAFDNIPSDVYVFTEAQTPPPASVTRLGWLVAHRPGGFPGVSGWGTIIAVRPGSGLQLEYLTTIEGRAPYVLDTAFPGSLTAANLLQGDRVIATVVGLYLPYRKDAQKQFIGHPSSDLAMLRPDFEAILSRYETPLIVAGDLNYEYSDVPAALDSLGNRHTRLVDPFQKQNPLTFEQDWKPHRRFKLDYIYLSRDLAKHVVAQRGGYEDFPTALQISDHAPLQVTISF